MFNLFEVILTQKSSKKNNKTKVRLKKSRKFIIMVKKVKEVNNKIKDNNKYIDYLSDIKRIYH